MKKWLRCDVSTWIDRAVGGAMVLALVWFAINGVYGSHNPPTLGDELVNALQYDMRVSTGATDLRAQYQSKFDTTRAHIKKERLADGNWVCEGCGRTEAKVGLFNMHHVISVLRIFSEGLDETLVYDKSNMVIVCRDCHFRVCHDPDGPSGPLSPNWQQSNPNCRRDLAKAKKTLMAP